MLSAAGTIGTARAPLLGRAGREPRRRAPVAPAAVHARVVAATPAGARRPRARGANAAAPGRAAPTLARPDARCRGFFDNLFGGGKKSDDDDAPSDAADAADAASAPADSPPDAPSTAAAVESAAASASTSTKPKPYIPKTSVKSTMSTLDALLPPDEAELKKKAEEAADEARAEQAKRTKIAEDVVREAEEAEDGGASVSISPNALKALQDAEKARASGKVESGVEAFGKKGLGEEDDGRWLDQVVDGLSDSARRDRDERTPEENAKLDKVLEDLSELAKKDAGERSNEEIRAKFDSLFEILEISDEPTVPKEDVQKLKDEVFGYNTFWVTKVEELGPEILGEGTLIRGNLRADRAEVWEKVQEGVERLFEGKYTVFMLEEPGSLLGDDDSPSASMSGSFDSNDPRVSRGPRVSFLIVPSDKAGPNPNTSAWQYFVAVALFGLTAGSALQLGLVAEVSRLPQATIEWLAAGSQGLDTSLAPGELPPGLENFDSAAYVEGAFPVFGGVFASALAHEVGHVIAGAATGIKTSIPFLIPNGQLGSFGSITQIKSLPKNREDLFDVSIAGPVAGGAVAGTLFAYGLALSARGGADLLPIPPELFSGSLLLGSISQLVLGDAAESAKGVMVHPLFIAGWCVCAEASARLRAPGGPPAFLFPRARLSRFSRAPFFASGS